MTQDKTILNKSLLNLNYVLDIVKKKNLINNIKTFYILFHFIFLESFYD